MLYESMTYAKTFDANGNAKRMQNLMQKTLQTIDPTGRSSRDDVADQAALAWRGKRHEPSPLDALAAEPNQALMHSGPELTHCGFDLIGIRQPKRTQTGPF